MSQDGLHQEQQNELVLNYLYLRTAVGITAFLLPTILVLFSWLTRQPVQPSISEFYFTEMGDVFVGTLCAVGGFLFAYRGFEREPGEFFSDKWVSRIAGVAVIAVALFPTAFRGDVSCASASCPVMGFQTFPHYLHFASAAIFFVALAIFCIFHFPKGERDADGNMALTPRAMTYYACGAALLISIAAMIWILLVPHGPDYDPGIMIFVWESVGVFAFSISWMIKGKAIRTVGRAIRGLIR